MAALCIALLFRPNPYPPSYPALCSPDLLLTEPTAPLYYYSGILNKNLTLCYFMWKLLTSFPIGVLKFIIVSATRH